MPSIYVRACTADTARIPVSVGVHTPSCPSREADVFDFPV